MPTQTPALPLIARVELVPGDSLTLSWRWKVSNIYEAGNAREKSGDDYPARIYVAFEFQPDKAGFFLNGPSARPWKCCSARPCPATP